MRNWRISVVAALLLIASGCGQSDTGQGAATPITAPTVALATITIPATLAPSEPAQATAPPMSPAPTGAPTNQCRVAAIALNLRSGPGTNYPIIDTLASDTILTALARSPDRMWIEAQILDQNMRGWVRAGDALITCSTALPDLIASLPQGDVPPLPTAPAQPDQPTEAQPPQPDRLTPVPPQPTEAQPQQPTKTPQPTEAQPPLPPPTVPALSPLQTATPFRPPERARPTPERP